MTDSSPPPSPIEVPTVSRREELLSALVDGQLTRAELGDLEELAVGEGTTLEVLARDFQRTRDAVADSVIDLRAPTELLDRQVAAALDSAAVPGIASLAVARTNRWWRRPRGQPVLQAMAAALLIVAGVGTAAILARGGSTSEDAATADTTDDSGATFSRQLDAATTTAPSAEELQAGASADGDAAGAELAADEADSFGAATAEPATISGLDPADLAAVAVFQDVAPEDLSYADRAEWSDDAGLACFPAAAALGEINGFAVIDLDGQIFEVFRTVEETTAVFSRADCDRVD